MGQPRVNYEGWNFNSGNYLFTTHLLRLDSCCVDSSNGAVYRLKNLWNSSEANATKWFLHLRNQVEVRSIVATIKVPTLVAESLFYPEDRGRIFLRTLVPFQQTIKRHIAGDCNINILSYD